MTQRPPSSRPGHDRAAAENRRKNRSKSGILLFHPRICRANPSAEEESQPACPGNRSGDRILPYHAAGRDAVGEQLIHTPTGMPAEKGWQRRLKAGTRSGRQMRTPPTSLADRRIMAFMSPPAYRQRFPPIRMDQKSLQSDRSCRLNLSYNPYCNSRSSSL